ncbi:MAG: response regulator [Chloroflexota bacterium]
MAIKTILVVDDSPTDLRLLSTPLLEKDYRIITASDGEEALEKVSSERPDLVLLDIILPKKNGFQVCRQIKTAPETKDIPVILISSKSQDSDRFWGLKQGADEYMTKPFEDDDLMANVTKFI